MGHQGVRPYAACSQPVFAKRRPVPAPKASTGSELWSLQLIAESWAVSSPAHVGLRIGLVCLQKLTIRHMREIQKSTGGVHEIVGTRAPLPGLPSLAEGSGPT